MSFQAQGQGVMIESFPAAVFLGDGLCCNRQKRQPNSKTNQSERNAVLEINSGWAIKNDPRN